MEQAKEIKPKERYTGTVLKTTLQGALVDIGSEIPAFIHISQAVKEGDPKKPLNSIEEVLEKGQKLDFWVKRVRKDRIELTMKEPLALEWREIKPGMTVKGTVIRLETFGAFIEIGAERPGLIHISELAHNYVRTPGEIVREGDEVEAQVLEVNRRKKQIKMSMKALQELPEQVTQQAEVKAKEEEPAPEPDLTAMEIAMRQAMEKSEGDEGVELKQKPRRKKSADSEQDEILSRTLEKKVGQDS